MENELQPINPGESPWEEQQPLPMRWHGFLIYAGLWLGAVSNIFSAAGLFTGGIYSGNADLVYETLAGLRQLDILQAVLLLGLAVFEIMTRFALAGYRRCGPKMLNLLYILAAAFSIFYVVTVTAVTGMPVGDTLFSLVQSLISAVVMICINRVYYKKRQHLFVND